MSDGEVDRLFSNLDMGVSYCDTVNTEECVSNNFFCSNSEREKFVAEFRSKDSGFASLERQRCEPSSLYDSFLENDDDTEHAIESISSNDINASISESFYDDVELSIVPRSVSMEAKSTCVDDETENAIALSAEQFSTQLEISRPGLRTCSQINNGFHSEDAVDKSQAAMKKAAHITVIMVKKPTVAADGDTDERISQKSPENFHIDVENMPPVKNSCDSSVDFTKRDNSELLMTPSGSIWSSLKTQKEAANLCNGVVGPNIANTHFQKVPNEATSRSISLKGVSSSVSFNFDNSFSFDDTTHIICEETTGNTGTGKSSVSSDDGDDGNGDDTVRDFNYAASVNDQAYDTIDSPSPSSGLHKEAVPADDSCLIYKAEFVPSISPTTEDVSIHTPQQPLIENTDTQEVEESMMEVTDIQNTGQSVKENIDMQAIAQPAKEVTDLSLTGQPVKEVTDESFTRQPVKSVTDTSFTGQPVKEVTDMSFTPQPAKEITDVSFTGQPVKEITDLPFTGRLVEKDLEMQINDQTMKDDVDAHTPAQADSLIGGKSPLHPFRKHKMEKNSSAEITSDDSSDEDVGVYAESFRRSHWVRVSQEGKLNVGKPSLSLSQPVQSQLSLMPMPDSMGSIGTESTDADVSCSPTADEVFADLHSPPSHAPLMHKRSDSMATTASETEFKCQYVSRRKCLIQRADSQQEYHRLSSRVYDHDKQVVVHRTSESEDLGLHILDSHPAYITSVDPGSAAEKAGITEGQILVSINDQSVLTTDHSDIVKLIHGLVGDIKLGVASSDFYPVRDLQAPILSGYMHKLGNSTFKIWKKRYFVLRHDNCLYYYKHEQESDPLGAVPLGGYTISRHTDTSKDFCFKAEKYGGRTYYFVADSRDQMTGWVGALTEAATRSKRRKESFLSVSSHNVGLPALHIMKPECAGFLGKLSPSMRSWRRRYCILKDACVYYYKDKGSVSALGVAHLHGYTVDVENFQRRRFSFSLQPPEKKMRVFCFSSDNETDKKRWVESLIHSIQRWVKVDKEAEC